MLTAKRRGAVQALAHAAERGRFSHSALAFCSQASRDEEAKCDGGKSGESVEKNIAKFTRAARDESLVEFVGCGVDRGENDGEIPTASPIARAEGTESVQGECAEDEVFEEVGVFSDDDDEGVVGGDVKSVGEEIYEDVALDVGGTGWGVRQGEN